MTHGIKNSLTFLIQHLTKEKKRLRETRWEHPISGYIDVLGIAGQIPSVPNQSNKEAEMRLLIC